MERDFGGIIWTNHAIERMKERGIKQGDAWATWKNPEQTRKASTRSAWVYYKTYGNERLEVVATKNDRGEIIVLSVWSKPLYDSRKIQHKYTTWDRLLDGILKSLFGWARRGNGLGK